MAKPIIEGADIDITYNKGKSNEFKALNGVHVEIYPREYIILFGPSGCGKSTLMYSILGGLIPSRGQLFVKGENIYDYKPEEIVNYQRTTVGIIYQQFNLIPSITVLENVALPKVFMGSTLKDRTELASGLLERFGINAKLAKKIPTDLSGGQQQRVAVARSLVNNPEILLADEPVGNLDSISAEQVMGMLSEINEKERKTVILVTHDAKYLPYAHRVVYMRDGGVRRVVVNPEKKQRKPVKSGETIVTEIEQLARLYPYSEPMELKVKSIVNYLTQELNFGQIEQLEKNVLKIIQGKMDQDMFYEFLLDPIKDGGLGMVLSIAVEMREKVAKLINQSHDIRRFRDETKDSTYFFHQQKFIDRLKEYLMQEFNVTLSSIQKKVFLEAVSDRISGIITNVEFGEKMSLPLDLGGVALSERLSHHITRYLEKLIAQGGYIINETSVH